MNEDMNEDEKPRAYWHRGQRGRNSLAHTRYAQRDTTPMREHIARASSVFLRPRCPRFLVNKGFYVLGIVLGKVLVILGGCPPVLRIRLCIEPRDNHHKWGRG